jgi:hypothetical protein
MNLQERFTVFCLTAFDRLMDVVTLGLWSMVRGEVTWSKMKVKK